MSDVLSDSKSDTCRLKVGIREIDERWYVFVEIWDNEHCEGRPIDERYGPANGCAVQADALIYYHENVRPITEMLIVEAKADGVEVQNLIKQLLH
ncbi:hypothetical protein LCGC14_1683470 [marine sediment metagenome]|uniref:Uncharacterized protein n=1 Tax=marine sediment metagenome TaxID=412755 RepID=A0A0F9HNE6_9ZZZZ